MVSFGLHVVFICQVVSSSKNYVQIPYLASQPSALLKIPYKLESGFVKLKTLCSVRYRTFNYFIHLGSKYIPTFLETFPLCAYFKVKDKISYINKAISIYFIFVTTFPDWKYSKFCVGLHQFMAYLILFSL